MGAEHKPEHMVRHRLRLSEVAIPTFSQFPRWLFKDQRAVWVMITFLLVADLVLIAVHTYAELAGSSNELLRIDVDRGYAESFQAIKYIYLIVLTTFCVFTYRTWQMAIWLLLFGYLLVDDMMMVHETYGFALIDILGLQPAYGLRALDFGEVIVSAIAAITLGIPLMIGFLYGNKPSRWLYSLMLTLVCLLATFGVIVDLAHVKFAEAVGHFDWIAVVEDGGEMIVVTWMVVLAVRVVVSGGSPGLLPESTGNDAGLPAHQFQTGWVSA